VHIFSLWIFCYLDLAMRAEGWLAAAFTTALYAGYFSASTATSNYQ
jgi:hypothetical protein